MSTITYLILVKDKMMKNMDKVKEENQDPRAFREHNM